MRPSKKCRAASSTLGCSVGLTPIRALAVKVDAQYAKTALLPSVAPELKTRRSGCAPSEADICSRANCKRACTLAAARYGLEGLSQHSSTAASHASRACGRSGVVAL